jgi:hypothetical protein
MENLEIILIEVILQLDPNKIIENLKIIFKRTILQLEVI